MGVTKQRRRCSLLVFIVGGKVSRMRKVTLATLAITSSIGATLVAAAPAQAATRLGGISVERECQDQDGYHARVKDWSAFGWRCNPFSAPVPASALIYDKSVDMNRACRRQYPRPTAPYAYATYADAGNPYSWSCYR